MIRAIDKESINNICSGQVIFDLSIAVKELVENSIDAGATKVEIRLKEFGEESIEVIDNGSGVDPNNFVGLTMKHCTSKIENFADILSVETYGFRGEALSSLCSLSNVTITTRTSTQTLAQKLVFDKDGKIITQTPIAREVGTTVHLSNLFKCLPVRYQEFKRNIKKEYSKLLTILQAYALVLTKTRISCFNQAGKSPRNCVLTTNTTPTSTMRDNLISVFGSKINQTCDEFTASDSLFKVSGLISKVSTGSGMGQSISNTPSSQQSFSALSRSCADRQFFFINSRPIEQSKLAKEINSLYQNFHKRGSFPVIIFNIETPTTNYDVNVTPDKRTVFLQKELQLIKLITDGLKLMWEAARSVFDSSQIDKLAFDDDDDDDDDDKKKKQTKISSFPNLYQLKSEDEIINKKPTNNNNNNSISINNNSSTSKSPSKIKGSLVLNDDDDDDDGAGFGNDDSFGDEQPFKKIKYDGRSSNYSNKKQDLPKTPHPTKKKGIQEDEDEEDNYVQPTFSKNSTVNNNNNNNNNSSSSKDISKKKSNEDSLDDILKDIDIYNSKSNDSNSLDDFEFKGSSKNVNNSGSGNKILDNINKAIDSMKQQLSPQQQQQQQQQRATTTTIARNNSNSRINCEDDENEEEAIDGYKQKNSKTFDVTIKTDIDSICKQYLIRNGIYDENNNAVIPDTELVVSNDSLVDSSVITQSTATIDKCCIIDKVVPHLDGKFSNSLGSVGAKQQIEVSNEAEQELTRYLKKEYFKQMIVIGQFNLGFIIAKLGNDLFIVDQHAADEKYNFEMLSKSIEFSSQPLIKPDTLSDLTSDEEIIIIDNLDLFERNGFKFVIDEDAPPKSKIKLSAFPIIHGQSFGIKDIYEWIFLIKESSMPSHISRIPRLSALLASKACRKSIMVGTALTHKEMKDVLNNLSTLDNPWACPHGRPTIRHLIDVAGSLEKVKQQQNK